MYHISSFHPIDAPNSFIHPSIHLILSRSFARNFIHQSTLRTVSFPLKKGQSCAAQRIILNFLASANFILSHIHIHHDLSYFCSFATFCERVVFIRRGVTRAANLHYNTSQYQLSTNPCWPLQDCLNLLSH